MIHPCCLILEFKSEKHDEGEQYIAQCWNDVYIEWVWSILHIVLRWNEILKEITSQADQSQSFEGIYGNCVRSEKQMSS